MAGVAGALKQSYQLPGDMSVTSHVICDMGNVTCEGHVPSSRANSCLETLLQICWALGALADLLGTLMNLLGLPDLLGALTDLMGAITDPMGALTELLGATPNKSVHSTA